MTAFEPLPLHINSFTYSSTTLCYLAFNLEKDILEVEVSPSIQKEETDYTRTLQHKRQCLEGRMIKLQHHEWHEKSR